MPEAKAVIAPMRERAENLYATKQLLCTEAVLVALNEGFQGGLTEEQAVGLTAGLTIGLGGSGCLCGAVSGGVLGIGLVLGGSAPHRHRATIRGVVNRFHDQFKTTHHSTCCRILAREVKNDAQAHFLHCQNLTGEATQMAAESILETRPHLLNIASGSAAVHRRDSRLRGRLRWLFRIIFS
ncbi:MAG: C-GCAxxG-C-C family protein [Thermodesulfobacteriota bacterium]